MQCKVVQCCQALFSEDSVERANPSQHGSKVVFPKIKEIASFKSNYFSAVQLGCSSIQLSDVQFSAVIAVMYKNIYSIHLY